MLALHNTHSTHIPHIPHTPQAHQLHTSHTPNHWKMCLFYINISKHFLKFLFKHWTRGYSTKHVSSWLAVSVQPFMSLMPFFSLIGVHHYKDSTSVDFDEWPKRIDRLVRILWRQYTNNKNRVICSHHWILFLGVC